MLRLRQTVAAMQAASLSAMVVTSPADVRWLTGFTGSNAAVALTGRRARLFTDGRYRAQVLEESPGIPITIVKKSVTVEACVWLEKAGAKTCAFDSLTTSVVNLEAMRHSISTGARRKFFQAAPGFLADLRQIKDESEIVAMRRAAKLGCTLFEQMLSVIEPGMTELQVAAELEYRARMAGAEGMSFETIVASGVRGGLPHGRATAKKLEAGEMVTLDFGVILDGYCSDMTRTVYLSYSSLDREKRGKQRQSEQKHVFDAVLEAQIAAVQAVRPGATCDQVDAAARQVLIAAGLGKAFSHSTGHGVGLQIHEGPRVGAKQQQVLKPGMIITIEPGAYLEGNCGVRIEDMVLVTETGFEILTPIVKSWFEL